MYSSDGAEIMISPSNTGFTPLPRGHPHVACPQSAVGPSRHVFGGMEASDGMRLREVETENSRLKKLLAEAQLDIEALKQAFGVKRYPHRRSARRSRGCWNRASFRSAGVSSGGVIQGQLAPSAAGDGGGNRLAGNHHHPRPATPPVWLSPHP